MSAPLAAAPLVIGPDQIRRIAQAVEALTPWLTQGRFRLLPNGNLEFSDAEPAEAIRLLRGELEDVVPEPLRERLGRKSGLGWNVWFGHVVGYWLQRRRFMGFLRALVDRAELHGVELQLHWNQGREVPVVRRTPGNGALVGGGVLGLVGGLAITRMYPADPILALLVFGLGLVLGRIWQRVVQRRVCGDRLCRAPAGRRATCPSCGATLDAPRWTDV